jgi:hypothetical protein
MTDAKTNYLEDALLNHVLRNTAYTSPTTIYVALYTVMPTDVGGGTEVSGGSYARQAVTFSAPISGTCASFGAVTFPVASAPWGEVLGMGLFDDVSAGELLYYGLLATSKIVGTGDQIAFASGSLTVQES